MKLVFLSKTRQAGDACSFVFQPVEPVAWTAGQSIRLEIGGEERRFSIVSAPFEQNIAIATRLSDSRFKQLLANLSPSDVIDGYGIEGDFLWETGTSKHVLLASGIGITPYIPMFRQLHHDRRPIAARLVYANRDDEFVFGDELRKLAAGHPELKVDFLPGQRLGRGIIKKYAAELGRSTVYVSGPEAMVREVSEFLLAAGVPETRLRQDLFTGRAGWDG